jgi:LemA protein
VIVTYNGLVRLNARIDQALANIGVQLKRRNDLFGNVAETVKGYAKQEKDIWDKFAQARDAVAKAVQTGNVKDMAASETSFGAAIQGMRVIGEQYPELKSNQNFSEFQSTIEDTEDKIQAARRLYNEGVTQFNIKIKVFPNNVFAGALGFKARENWDTKDHGELDEGLSNDKTEVKF